jgi:hypothetical protein
MTSLFSSYQAKGQLKFFKSSDNEEKLTISIGISSNHQMNSNLYESISVFLDKLLIGDYINEEMYNEIKEREKEEELSIKLLKKQEKENAKYLKEKEKEAKKAKKTTKKVTKSSKSLY